MQDRIPTDDVLRWPFRRTLQGQSRASVRYPDQQFIPPSVHRLASSAPSWAFVHPNPRAARYGWHRGETSLRERVSQPSSNIDPPSNRYPRRGTKSPHLDALATARCGPRRKTPHINKLLKSWLDRRRQPATPNRLVRAVTSSGPAADQDPCHAHLAPMVMSASEVHRREEFDPALRGARSRRARRRPACGAECRRRRSSQRRAR